LETLKVSVGRKIQLGTLGLCAVVLTACGSGGPPAFSISQAKGDVAVTGCIRNPDGFAVAQIKVTNHSSFEADYVTTVDFSINGSSTKSGPGFERGVGAGRSVPDQVVSTAAVASGSTVKCVVASVTRTPSTVTTTT
jgi:hypothetical protein